MPVVFLDQVGEQFALSFAVHRVDLLRDSVGGGVAARHFDHRRLVEQAVGQRLDLVGEGGGEQQVLALLGQQREDLA